MLESIREAIIALAKEDRDSHPGYDTLVDEYFRLSEALNGFTSSQIEFKKNLTAELDKVKKELTGKIEVTINEINTLLREKVADIDNRLSELTALVNSKLKELTDNLKRDFEAYKTSSTQRINELSIQITNNKTELQLAINTAKDDLERKLAELRSDFNRDQLQQNQRMDQLEAKINEFGNSSNIVRTTGDQVIDGHKKFKRNISLADVNNEWKASFSLNSSGNLYILNKFAGSTSSLSFGENDITYNNKKLITIDEYNTLQRELNTLREAVNKNTQFRESLVFITTSVTNSGGNDDGSLY